MSKRKKINPKMNKNMDKAMIKYPYQNETPDAQNAESASETPDAQNAESASETSDAQNAESASETSDAQNAESVSETPDAQNAESTSETPDAQNAESTSETPDAQNAENASETPGTQNAESASETPDAQNAESTSEIPDAQNAESVSETPDAQNAESTSETPDKQTSENVNETCSENPLLNENKDETETNFESLIDENFKLTIKVFGVGGGGGNTVDTMIHRKLSEVSFIAGNTDLQALNRCMAETRIQLGKKCTEGLGAGANPDIGRKAAEEQIEEIKEALEGTKLLFITAGMGGGTGTGAAPVIAKTARELGILTVSVVTKPFEYEGIHRMEIANKGIQELQEHSDTLITILNQNLFFISTEVTSFIEAFRKVDDFLYSCVRGLTDLILRKGYVNRDFADIKAVMKSTEGEALMGIGEGEGEGAEIKAAEEAISNPLLAKFSMHGAGAVLVNIISDAELTLFQIEQALERIRDGCDPKAKLIWGCAIDSKLKGIIRVLVIATGIDAARKNVLKVVPPLPNKKDTTDGSVPSHQYFLQEQVETPLDSKKSYEQDNPTQKGEEYFSSPQPPIQKETSPSSFSLLQRIKNLSANLDPPGRKEEIKAPIYFKDIKN